MDGLKTGQVETYAPPEYREIAYTPVLPNADYGAPKETISNHAVIYPERQELATSKLQSAHLEPRRVERILPSIEVPSRHQRATNDILNVETSNLRFLEARDFRVVERLDHFDLPIVNSRQVELDQSERLNPFKRRRFNIPDEQDAGLFEVKTGANNHQRSILIPLENHPRQNSDPQRTARSQHTEESPLLLVEKQPALVHSPTGVNLRTEPREGPLFSYSDKNVVKLRNEPSYHHSQVLLSPGLSHPTTKSINLQTHLKNHVSARSPLTHEPSDPYIYLQHHERASDSTSRYEMPVTRDVRVSEEEKRLGRFFIEQPLRTSSFPKYHPPLKEFRDAPTTMLVRESSGQIYPHQEPTRVRRYLPLESPLEGLKPLGNTSPEYIGAQRSSRHQVHTTQSINDGVYAQTSSQTNSRHRLPGYDGQGSMRARFAVPDFHRDTHQSAGTRGLAERRYGYRNISTSKKSGWYTDILTGFL